MQLAYMVDMEYKLLIKCYTQYFLRSFDIYLWPCSNSLEIHKQSKLFHWCKAYLEGIYILLFIDQIQSLVGSLYNSFQLDMAFMEGKLSIFQY